MTPLRNEPGQVPSTARTDDHKKYACARLFLFLQREIDEQRPLTEGERTWYETELKVRPDEK
jgi:hypothetical protein